MVNKTRSQKIGESHRKRTADSFGLDFLPSVHSKNDIERLFKSKWKGMKRRCTNKNESSYKDYGGRGIKVCERWDTFAYFFIDMWDSYLLHKALNGTTELDRIDNSKGYYKENCRWVTHAENSNNRRNRQLFRGKTLKEWSVELGVKRSTLAQRYYVYGWSVDKTLDYK